jgi:transglutaminase-like putative cysteine protease
VPTTSEPGARGAARRLGITHRTVYRYEPAAPSLAIRLRLFPSRTICQNVIEWRIEADGEPVTPMLVNGFGDREALWMARRPVPELTLVATGTVETADVSGMVGRMGRAPPGVFLRRTPLTEADEAVRSFAASVATGDDLEALHALNVAVAGAIAYRPGATLHGATAAEALALGAGVCQDQTHLFLAAARHLGHPARYVVGYLHDEETVHSETHAWAEAHVDGLGWVGFDPTHGRSPTEGYVRLCAGLDAADAAPLRGTYPAGPAETLDVSVAVTGDAAAPQRQQQQ